MKLKATQLVEINKMVEIFNKNTGINLDISEILTSIGTKLEAKEDFKEAYLSVYKEALNNQVVPGVMKQIKNNVVVDHAGTYFNNVMEVIWDSLAPESYIKEEEDFSKGLHEAISENSNRKKELYNEFKNLDNQMKKQEEKMFSTGGDPSAKALKKQKDINEKLIVNIEELEQIDEEAQVINRKNDLFAHMIKNDCDDMVREAFRNNVHFAGESVPSYKIAAKAPLDNLTINRALINSSFTSANMSITWDEYSVDDFHALIGTLSESYMILDEKYNNMKFFKRLFSKEARVLRGEMASCVSELNNLQDRMIGKNIMAKADRIDVKAELKAKAESMREMPDDIKKKIEDAFKNFSTDIKASVNKSRKEKFIDSEKIKRIEINEIDEEEKKEEIAPIIKENKINENEAELDQEGDLFANFD